MARSASRKPINRRTAKKSRRKFFIHVQAAFIGIDKIISSSNISNFENTAILKPFPGKIVKQVQMKEYMKKLFVFFVVSAFIVSAGTARSEVHFKGLTFKDAL